MMARSEFNQLAKNLHHLSSTLTIPGVYNPPYARIKPTAFDVDIETHLKSTFHVFLLEKIVFFLKKIKKKLKKLSFLCFFIKYRLIINGNL